MCMNSFVIGPCITDIASVIGPGVVTVGATRGLFLLGLFVGIEVGYFSSIACSMVMTSVRSHMQ